MKEIIKDITTFIIIFLAIMFVNYQHHKKDVIQEAKIEHLKKEWLIKTKALREVYGSDIWLN